MLKIAICDDEINELTKLTGLIVEYNRKNGSILDYDTFLSSTDLIMAVSKNVYDIILLDIMMSGINGMETAHELRQSGCEANLVFITSTPEFAVESYSVNAYYYLLKPCKSEQLFPIFDTLISSLKKSDDYLHIHSFSGIYSIPISAVEYVEVMNRKIYFHLTDGTTKTTNGTLSDYESMLLNNTDFTKVHRSYLVNMNSIQSICPKELTTYSGHFVPISRLLYKHVRDTYMNHLLKEKGVI